MASNVYDIPGAPQYVDAKHLRIETHCIGGGSGYTVAAKERYINILAVVKLTS